MAMTSFVFSHCLKLRTLAKYKAHSSYFGLGGLLSVEALFVTLCLTSLLGFLSQNAHADINLLNSNGYTGSGLMPNANTINTGKSTVSFENQIPGVANTKGFDYNVGFGVTDNFEASARLATQDLHCNMFATSGPSACAEPNMIRHFSTAVKLKISKEWMDWVPGLSHVLENSPVPFLNSKTTYALGMVDFAGATNYFGSEYAVATQHYNHLEFSVGYGKASTTNPLIHTAFASAQWDPTPWSRVAYDQSGKNAWLHSTVYAHLLDDHSLDLYLTLHERLTTTTITEKSWVGFGISVPLTDVKEQKAELYAAMNNASMNKTAMNKAAMARAQVLEEAGLAPSSHQTSNHQLHRSNLSSGSLLRSESATRESDTNGVTDDSQSRALRDLYPKAGDLTLGGARFKLPKIKKFDLQDDLIKNGFQKAKFGIRDNTLFLWVDQENFQWNAMDAAGVAMGLLASTFGQSDARFELIVGTRGLDVLEVRGGIACVKSWFEVQDMDCARSIKVQSLISHTVDLSGVKWEFDTTNIRRPELVLSPTLTNTLGNEYGVFDLDVAVNVNPVVNLWQGANLDVNEVVPLGVRTQNFNQGGAYYASRIQQQLQRNLVHHVFNLDQYNTQVMASAGKLYQSWTGAAMETNSLSDNGKHRLNLELGKFQFRDPGFVPADAKFELASYRYSMDNRYNASTEITAGKFWGGDEGFKLTERFWYGDTALNFYVRQSRKTPQDPKVSFAGFQLWIPLTPRANNSSDYFNVRGTSQYTYLAESKILEANNLLTSGLGVIPNLGDSLIVLSNRDRTSDSYYEARKERLRLAYLELRLEDRKSWVFD